MGRWPFLAFPGKARYIGASHVRSLPVTVAEALEQIYASLENDNAEIDARIRDAKAAMAAEGLTVLTVEPGRLAQNNRQGRKIMQSYFKKRGVTVEFSQA